MTGYINPASFEPGKLPAVLAMIAVIRAWEEAPIS